MTSPTGRLPGVVFKDITPLLADPAAFAAVVDALAAGRTSRDRPVDLVAGVEARGFVLGAPVAYGWAPASSRCARRASCPATCVAASYALEYGTATLEVQADASAPGDRVLVVDDVLATGGTAAATFDLVRAAGAEVVGVRSSSS